MTGLELGWNWVGTGFELGWSWVGTGLELGWNCFGIGQEQGETFFVMEKHLGLRSGLGCVQHRLLWPG